MLPLETATTFFAAACLLALAPGPDNIFALTQSTLHGSRAGFIITFGLCTGLIVHTLAVAFGVAAVIQTSAAAFTVLTSIGAAYLLYLAWLAFHARSNSSASPSGDELPRRSLYLRGVLMNLSNPKVALFFLAFLPQFADPARGPMSIQLILLGSLFICATILVFGGIALLAGTLGQAFLRSSSAQRILNRIAAALFVGLAVKLIVSARE